MTSLQKYKTSLFELFSSLLRNRELILQLAQREVLGRYRGSIMGLAWSFFTPLLMLTVYTFLFSIVFKAKWGLSSTESHMDFAVILFSGLIIHGLFSECINRTPHLVNSHVNYVKKIVFPLEVLPWIAVSSALFHLGISLIVLLVAQLILGVGIPWTVVFLPLILAPLILMIMGFTWFLSSTVVYIKDIAQTVGILTSILLFVSPVFYPISALPHKLQFWVMFNPLTLIIEQWRNVLIFGHVPNWTSLGIYSVVSLLIAWSGFWWFQKARKGFADVL